MLVVGRYQGPGRKRGTSSLYHLVDCDSIVVPAFSVAVILVGDLVFLVGRGLSITETAKLLVAVDVKPELVQWDTAPDDLIFEVVDQYRTQTKPGRSLRTPVRFVVVRRDLPGTTIAPPLDSG